MLNCVYEVGKSLYEQFPEMTFILITLLFLIQLAIRQLQEVNISASVERFHTGKTPFNFDTSVVRS